jgi:hypothetical protein
MIISIVWFVITDRCRIKYLCIENLQLRLSWKINTNIKRNVIKIKKFTIISEQNLWLVLFIALVCAFTSDLIKREK